MSDMVPDMNSSSQKGTREKNLKTNITIHISTNHTETQGMIWEPRIRTLPLDGKRGGRYSSQREQHVQRVGQEKQHGIVIEEKEFPVAGVLEAQKWAN